MTLALAVTGDDGRSTMNPLIGLYQLPLPHAVTALAACTLLAGYLHWLSERLIMTVCTEATVTVRSRLLSSYCNAGWHQQAAERPGSLQELVSSCAVTVSQGMLTASSALVAAAQMAVLTVTAVVISPVAALAIVTVGTAGLAVAHPFRARTRRLARDAVRANDDLAAIIGETTLLSRDMWANGVHTVGPRRARTPIEKAARLTARVRFESRMVPTVSRDLTILGVGLALAVVSQTTVIAIGSIGAIVLLVVRAVGLGQQISTALQALSDRQASLNQISTAIERYRRAAPSTTGRPAPRLEVVRFEDVWFTYPSTSEPTLAGVDLTLRPGSVVGIVGGNAAGKSTLLHLLLRLAQPTRGRIAVNDVDIRHVSLTSWLSQVSLVPQDPALLDGTVAENIRFLRHGIEEVDVQRAAQAAGLDEDLRSWPQGLSHPVGPLGRALSGGQRQRIALARALAGKPRLLVLDEPTSALDTHTEAIVRDTIERVRQHAAVLIVTHRASTLSACDRVLELRRGRLIEQVGTAHGDSVLVEG
ncbi:ABC transporter ATP-binding protein [Verrucosispora sp. WMMA2044]|uniref:ABC transporter ATP-binding protein n=1 Tax=Verrucosispora sioxanthis TaxID=2499994 RepID=A0A6M1KRD2_9ACTN|nr:MULTISPECIES: ABC transporter ATP-binding protein [Micromonospora]NEE62455.1 ABC transporter ATP-binding protein [Verrucosispora sioxanthis]NGM11565.1 ABC transporter ATP-binding protein [Verrucosispora sioxanthis]WBB46808.1 ABC transporter ATP-binding protein [Verrucosispora sp. WMMA2044]